MEEVVRSVKRVADMMTEITAASREQSSGIEQVNQAVAQMDEVTQQNAALVEQAAAAAESLDEQARNLARAVGAFRLTAAVEVLGDKFDFETAINAHAAWRQRLHAFVNGRGEALDAKKVGNDSQCALGGWIHGPGKHFAKYAEYEDLRSAHSAFHRWAGEIVQLSESGKREQAERTLGDRFAAASEETVERLYAMKKLAEQGKARTGEHRLPARALKTARSGIQAA